MAQTLYYPGRSTYWDTVSQRRALGQPYSPELLRAGLEGERLGELSAYYAAADRQRGRDLESERISVSREQMSSAERIAEENRQSQEQASMVGTVGQLAVAAPMMYGAGKQAGWWGAPAAAQPYAATAPSMPWASTGASPYGPGIGQMGVQPSAAVNFPYGAPNTPLEFGSEEAYAAYLQSGGMPSAMGGQTALASSMEFGSEEAYAAYLQSQSAQAATPWASYLSISNPYTWPAYAYLGGDMMEKMLPEGTFGKRFGQTAKDIVSWPFQMATNPGATWERTKAFGGDVWENTKEAPQNIAKQVERSAGDVGREVSRAAEKVWDFATSW